MPRTLLLTLTTLTLLTLGAGMWGIWQTLVPTNALAQELPTLVVWDPSPTPRFYYPNLPAAWTPTPAQAHQRGPRPTANIWPSATPIVVWPTVTPHPVQPSPTLPYSGTRTPVAPPSPWPEMTLEPYWVTPAAPGAPKRIVVSVGQQRLYAYEGDTLVHTTRVSTGKASTPTVYGQFKIYYRLREQRMRGSDYDYLGVPFVQYFYRDYAFHAAYWHNQFGTPVSHGCVNLSREEAEWLFHWAAIGTVVEVGP